MTNEEAIFFMTLYKQRLEASISNDMDKDIEAFDTAIKALEQEPCDDCISRQSVKRKLQEHHDLFINAYGGRVGFKSMADAKEKARVDEITNCIAMIVNEPPVTPKEKTGHWIVDWSATSRLNRDRSLTYEYHVHCDGCGYRWDYTTDKKGSLVSNYCPNCGAKMIEPQESEDG